MTKLAKQPLCRFCGKKIAKYTRRRYIVTDPKSMKFSPETKLLVETLPQTREEAQKLFNEKLVTVKRAKRWVDTVDHHGYKDLGIGEVSLWDGESYVDEFFCNGDHAKRFGYATARAGYSMYAYRKAEEARKCTS